MAAIRLEAVSKSWDGKHRIVEPLSLNVEDGEFLVIVGPSGCGKTTLLRMVAGLETVSSGHIWIGDREVTQLEPKERRIAMVFQNFALYPHMSVHKNMSWGLQIQGMPKAGITERILQVARLLQIEDLLKHYPRALSGGQRQRVAIGRAIVRNPDVFLFDEPLSSLDARLRVEMRLELQHLHQRLQTTSLYVTHDQVEAMTLAQRVMVMNQGRAEQIDTPLAIYERPATIFVASFMGSPAMNLLSGSINEAGSALRISDLLSIPLQEQRPELARQEITLGIRPEHLVLVNESTHAVPLEVDSIEMLGADNLVYGKWGGQSVVVRVSSHVHPSLKTRIWLNMMQHRQHLFDTKTGARL